MDKRQELQTIVLSEYTTADQKKAAQIALDSLDNPAPARTPAPTPAPKTKHYMDWIPDGSLSQADTLNVLAQLRARFAAGVVNPPKPTDIRGEEK